MPLLIALDIHHLQLLQQGLYCHFLQKSNHVTQMRVELVILKVHILSEFPAVPTLYCTLTVMCIACVQPAHISQNDLLLGRCAAGIGNSAHYGNGRKATNVCVELETPRVHMACLLCTCCGDPCLPLTNSKRRYTDVRI